MNCSEVKFIVVIEPHFISSVFNPASLRQRMLVDRKATRVRRFELELK